MYWIDIGTEVAVLNSQVVPISQVVLKTGFTVFVLCPQELIPHRYHTDDESCLETDQESYIRTDDEDGGNTDWEDARRRWVNR